VFHQVSYAVLVFGVVFKSISLFRKVPDSCTYEKPRLQMLLWSAASGFLIAFALWNVDNQFCSHLRSWRHNVPLLVGGVSEVIIILLCEKKVANNMCYSFMVGGILAQVKKEKHILGIDYFCLALGVYYYIVYCEWLVHVLSKEKKEYRLHWCGPVCYIRSTTETTKKE
jgi:dihydroceramidase